MKQFLKKLWKSERGAETVEWVVIAALVIAAAAVVYSSNGKLKTTMENGLDNIETHMPS